jgi:quinol monooxygenase YgiN
VELKATGAAVAAVTHVDVIPPQRENGTAFTKQLAEDSRKEAGNMRFEAVVQVARQNHFTVIEVWRDRKTADTHSTAEHSRAFREKLAPATGALYDERFYRFMN